MVVANGQGVLGLANCTMARHAASVWCPSHASVAGKAFQLAIAAPCLPHGALHQDGHGYGGGETNV